MIIYTELSQPSNNILTLFSHKTTLPIFLLVLIFLQKCRHNTLSCTIGDTHWLKYQVMKVNTKKGERSNCYLTLCRSKYIHSELKNAQSVQVYACDHV